MVVPKQGVQFMVLNAVVTSGFWMCLEHNIILNWFVTIWCPTHRRETPPTLPVKSCGCPLHLPLPKNDSCCAKENATFHMFWQLNPHPMGLHVLAPFGQTQGWPPSCFGLIPCRVQSLQSFWPELTSHKMGITWIGRPSNQWVVDGFWMDSCYLLTTYLAAPASFLFPSSLIFNAKSSGKQLQCQGFRITTQINVTASSHRSFGLHKLHLYTSILGLYNLAITSSNIAIPESDPPNTSVQ